MKKSLALAALALSTSSAAFGFGWSCNDTNGDYWRFTGASLNSGQIAANATGQSNPIIFGSYTNLMINQHWDMVASFGNFQAGYSCNTSDGGAGQTYYCGKTWGAQNMQNDMSMINCQGFLF